jgi:hypothetical protein
LIGGFSGSESSDRRITILRPLLANLRELVGREAGLARSQFLQIPPKPDCLLLLPFRESLHDNRAGVTALLTDAQH